MSESAEIKQIGNFSNSKRNNPNQNRVYDREGIAPCLNTMEGGGLEPHIIDSTYQCREPREYSEYSPTLRNKQFEVMETVKVEKVDFIDTVKTRTLSVDTEKLKLFLIKRKKDLNLTNNIIAEKINIPITKVEHWFRNDKSFAIPDKDNWNKLKSVLQITETEFDESITSFEEKENSYDKTNRCYLENGLSPTLTSTNADEKIIQKQDERFFNQALETLENNDCESGDTIDAFNKKVNKRGARPTLTTRPEGFKTAILPVVERYRIRKLTPKECFRLQGWSDEYYRRAELVNSNSQLYKQAGNGVTTDVIYNIVKEWS